MHHVAGSGLGRLRRDLKLLHRISRDLHRDFAHRVSGFRLNLDRTRRDTRDQAGIIYRPQRRVLRCPLHRLVMPGVSFCSAGSRSQLEHATHDHRAGRTINLNTGHIHWQNVDVQIRGLSIGHYAHGGAPW